LERSVSAAERLRRRLGDPRLLIAERQQLVDELTAALERRHMRSLAVERAGLEKLHRRLASRHPRAVLSRARADLGPLTERLASSIRLELGRASRGLGQASASLDSLSPLAVLGRGYAIATDARGRALRSATGVRPGDVVRVRLHRGKLLTEVTEVEEGSE
jgi:exodeoxyribonuclease VII large subunit